MIIELPEPRFFANAAEALFDRAAYDEMTAMLARATRSIRMEFFLFGGPHANAMIEVMAQKRDAGVDVRVTLDRSQGLLPQVKRECKAAYARLRARNLDARLSDARPFPDAPRKPALAHNKIIVVDDREALVGGMNVGTLFFHHHDVMIKLVGPTAGVLGRQFDHDRSFALDPALARSQGSPQLAPFALADAAPLAPGHTWARVVGTGVGRRTTRQALLQNLRGARVSVSIAMCEMGTTDVLDELIEVHRRGVRVRVLLDPLQVAEYLPETLGALRSLCPTGILNAGAIARLVGAGVCVRVYRTGPDFWLMHLKMAVFDDQSAVVGSTNWTRGGFEWVGETDVELHGGLVIDQLAAQFERDWRDRSLPAALPARHIAFLCRLYERVVQ